MGDSKSGCKMELQKILSALRKKKRVYRPGGGTMFLGDASVQRKGGGGGEGRRE